MNRVLAITLTLVVGCLIGCGSTLPPKELVDARAAFQQAASGPAAQLAPAELDTARQSLAKAEEAFTDDPESEDARDLAYVADRQAQMAEALAVVEQGERLKTGADRAFREASQEELARAREAVSSGKQALEAERKARQDAERRAKAAMESLAQVAAVKDEARGMVITLSGAVLFASSKSELLPIAREKLGEVAKAIVDQGGTPKLIVEGHTDSSGPRWQNMKLSQERADSVRLFLVERGIAAGQITAVGVGPDRPVADNKTTEGRANNRRVEIIVK